jgi:endoglucanase
VNLSDSPCRGTSRNDRLAAGLARVSVPWTMDGRQPVPTPLALGGLALILFSACASPPHPPICPSDCPDAPAPQPPQTAPASAFVRRAGLGLIDERGQPLKLRGVDLGGWLLWEGWIWGAALKPFHFADQAQSAIEERLAQAAGTNALCRFREGVRDRFVGEADLAAIAAEGFNVVRVPLNHRDFACASSPGWAVLDRLLNWCDTHHVYAVLEMHSAPGGQTKYFVSDPDPVLLWDSAEAKDRTVVLWKALARRYAGRAIVAGYDLLGEPMPPRGSDLVALDRRIVAAIREVDPNHTVIVEGTDFARDFSMFEGPIDDNEIYSFHMYTWFGDDRARRLAGYTKVAAAQGIPMWCGEFGENTAPMIASTLDLFDAQSPALVGWAFWTWKRTSVSNWATLHGIQLPGGWQTLIDWAVNNRGPRPDAKDARVGMDAFLGAAQEDHLTSDREPLKTLSVHARR